MPWSWLVGPSWKGCLLTERSGDFRWLIPSVAACYGGDTIEAAVAYSRDRYGSDPEQWPLAVPEDVRQRAFREREPSG
jgi:hypothetical protein